MKDKIARFIIEQVQKYAELNGFQYIVSYETVAMTFNITIREKEANIIKEELEKCEEVADVQLDDYGFDVVLCTDFAPNYDKELSL